MKKGLKWKTEVRRVGDLKGWEDNPRVISEDKYKELKESVGELGNFEPLVVDTDGTVIAGNQRLRVHIERGDEEVEVSVPSRELTEKEIKKIGLISNRHSGEWDMDKLAEEFDEVIEELGFSDLMGDVGGDNSYTKAIKVPIYEPKNEKPELGQVVNTEKAEELLKIVEESNLGEDEKEFLRKASTRFYEFNYSKVADYYAHSEGEMKDIMEKMALVIIDYNKAIENGFVRMTDYLLGMIPDDEE